VGTRKEICCLPALRSSRLPLHLTEQLIKAKHDLHNPKQEKDVPDETGPARMAGKNATRMVCGLRQETRLKGMVNPLTQANPKTSERNMRGCSSRECLQDVSP